MEWKFLLSWTPNNHCMYPSLGLIDSSLIKKQSTCMGRLIKKYLKIYAQDGSILQIDTKVHKRSIDGSPGQSSCSILPTIYTSKDFDRRNCGIHINRF